MKKTVFRILTFSVSAVLLLSAVFSVPVLAEPEGKTVKILFTHDIHSYFDVTKGMVDGKIREHGGAARLKTLLDRNRDENTLYLDGGDFSMGTLLQAGYTTDACELRLLGELGCDVTTLGNHEFDFGGKGVAQMLESALDSKDPLPQLVQSNMKVTGKLTKEQQKLSDAMKKYGAKSYTVLKVNGLKIAVFGLLGIDGIECAPTSGMDFTDYIESAKKTVEEIKEKEKPDVIVCLSHSGTSEDGKTGEDIDLAKEVPDIDLILSAHAHTKYDKPVTVGETLIVSSGEYLSYLGSIELSVGKDGVKCKNYKMIPCDGSVAEDAAVKEKVERFKNDICKNYLAKQNVGYDDVICRSPFDFISLKEMYATHDEYPMGNLIADSYIYEAEKNGIKDIDVALVGLGTVRGSFLKGDITVSDAFEICSLGVGADGSAGHPLLTAYITGEELKLLVELDASLGPVVSSIKMSYSGLNYTFNTKRVLLDRVTDIYLVRKDGKHEQIEDKKLYKVACNMYAANMLGMLNSLTRGILKIVPKYADGTPVKDFYTCSLKNSNGDEIKEWVAFMNYLSSFPKKNGVPEIPAHYAAKEGRKNKISKGGLDIIKDPGIATTAVMALEAALIFAVAVFILAYRRRRIEHEFRKSKKKRAYKKKEKARLAAKKAEAKKEKETTDTAEK